MDSIPLHSTAVDQWIGEQSSARTLDVMLCQVRHHTLTGVTQPEPVVGLPLAFCHVDKPMFTVVVCLLLPALCCHVAQGGDAGQQPRKRQRQTLESDDEGEGDAAGAMGTAGNGAASEDGYDELFD